MPHTVRLTLRMDARLTRDFKKPDYTAVFEFFKLTETEILLQIDIFGHRPIAKSNPFALSRGEIFQQRFADVLHSIQTLPLAFVHSFHHRQTLFQPAYYVF